MSDPLDPAPPMQPAPVEEKTPPPRKLGPTLARKAAPAVARTMLDEGEALTLDQHLGLGYDYYVHGKSRRSSWTPEAFGAALKDDDAMATDARQRLARLQAVLKARGEDRLFVEKIQSRILSDGLAKSRQA